MAKRISAGILLYRFRNGTLEVFLIHPGGPYWHGKDAGAWSIPKGELEEGDDELAAAQREFEEETGSRVSGAFLPLEPLRLKSGKIIHAWAVRGDIDASAIRSNAFSMEWPPRSGRQQEFPEVDRGGWTRSSPPTSSTRSTSRDSFSRAGAKPVCRSPWSAPRCSCRI
ncbi:MAG TPA: NUDIX domain-containing protein, partial [Casimicrobiaceae bacterium]|nr:NUDIX domain-containing protein [Casimicrobiaceae bacterium]